MRASSAKSQAESALTVFELREENHRLAKENSKLLGNPNYYYLYYSIVSAVGFQPLLQFHYISTFIVFIVYLLYYVLKLKLLILLSF